MVTVKLCDWREPSATTRAGTRAEPRSCGGRGEAVVLLEAVAVEAGELDLAARASALLGLEVADLVGEVALAAEPGGHGGEGAYGGGGARLGGPEGLADRAARRLERRARRRRGSRA